ncbi:MAG: tetratricopeptide repeat protein, partial [Verrucomicrobiales bacterium]
ATEGFPEVAMEFYDRALAADPEDLFIRMNRAACLTRLGRWEEATSFYRSILERGYHGRAYHLHDCLLRLWNIAETRESEPECLAYFGTLVDRTDIAWRSDLGREVLALLVRLQMTDEAMRFLPPRTDPTARLDGWRLVARGCREAGDFDRAVAILKEAAKEVSGVDGSRWVLEQDAAFLAAEQGRVDEAITRLKGIANGNRDPEAQDMLFHAARLADENGETGRARDLYRAFLASPSTSFPIRFTAGKRLAELGE